MVNYQQGKIYKIVCNTTGKVYIGSTCEQRLSQRLTKHVAKYKHYLKGNETYCSSYDLIEKGNYEIILLETYPCNSSEELRMRERFYKDNTECVNIYNPISTKEDKQESSSNYYFSTLEYQRLRKQEYYKNNKEKFKEYQANYDKAHKEAKNKRCREYQRHKALYLQQLKYYNI